MYINHLEAQRLLRELRKGKAFKELRLVDDLLKHKQSQVYVIQCKLRLLVLKKNIIDPMLVIKRNPPNREV